MKGKFITFEGCEGAGKSRQVKLLQEYLEKNKINYFLTREPGGTDISEQIRNIILDKNNIAMTNECEALLYASSRVQLLNEKVKKHIENGELVICDRYIDSSFAYQVYARGLPFDFVANINHYALKNFMPDCTLFLNITPEKAFLRKGGVDKNDRLELSGLEFHNKVYNGYIELSKKYADRFAVIDASGDKTQTHLKIIKALKDKKIL